MSHVLQARPSHSCWKAWCSKSPSGRPSYLESGPHDLPIAAGAGRQTWPPASAWRWFNFHSLKSLKLYQNDSYIIFIHIPHQVVSQEINKDRILRNTLIQNSLTAASAAFCWSAWNQVTSEVHSAVFRRKAKSLLRGSMKSWSALPKAAQGVCFPSCNLPNWTLGPITIRILRSIYNHM